MEKELLTNDPFANDVLTSENLAIVGDNDPHYAHVTRLSRQIATAKLGLPNKYAEIGEMLLDGAKRASICHELKTTYATIGKVAAHQDTNYYLALVAQLRQVRQGPSLEQRAAMLWRIATKFEEDEPRTAIIAVDTLNKQSGVYKKEEEKGGGGMTVNIQNFVMNSPGDAEKEVGDMTDQPVVVDGEFTPVEVSVDA